MVRCAYCNGSGKTGPTHVNYGGGRGEWLNNIPCFECDGTGCWDEARGAAFELGQKNRQARVNRGKTLREAAKEMGISPAELSRRERGLR